MGQLAVCIVVFLLFVRGSFIPLTVVGETIEKTEEEGHLDQSNQQRQNVVSPLNHVINTIQEFLGGQVEQLQTAISNLLRLVRNSPGIYSGKDCQFLRFLVF